MSGIKRREMLQRMGAVPVAAGFALSEARAERAHEHAQRQAKQSASDDGPYQRRFLDEHEWATVGVLADMILPADDRSGSATDAGVQAFIDFAATDEVAEPREREDMQTALRGGLVWLDRECLTRFSKAFLDCEDAQKRQVLDAIAWPERAAPEMSQGVAFFNMFRDLVASGYWTSKTGMDDIGYMGNTFVSEWTGCPPEALAKLGLPPEPKSS